MESTRSTSRSGQKVRDTQLFNSPPAYKSIDIYKSSLLLNASALLGRSLEDGSELVNATSAIAVLDDARGNLELEKSENVEP